MATLTQSASLRAGKAASVPWYLWCCALAVTSVTIGGQWDVSWHRSIGRDTFWTPAHIAIYLCGILAGIATGYLIFDTTFRKSSPLRRSSVRVLGFTAPLGAFLCAWGGVAMLTSAPFDNWWHNAYGLDVKIISPPHALLVLGIFAVKIGVLLLIASAINRAIEEDRSYVGLQALFLYVAGLTLELAMFFVMEYTLDIYLHRAIPYIAVAIGSPLICAAAWKASRQRWASTWLAVIYMAVLITAVLVLPLFPAAPKLGPVYQNVTHFVPPRFPILIIAPAIVLDLLWSRIGDRNKLLVAALSGPAFVLALVAAEWPFANFLMSKAADNRFFATGMPDYGTPSWAASVTRHFVGPEHGWTLWSGLGMAMVYAAVSVWLGLMLGEWMRKVQR